MKRLTRSVILSTLLTFFISTVNAQPPHQSRPGPPPPMGGLLKAMDTNEDGMISEAKWTVFHLEMFKNIDKDKNGNVTDEELRPPFEEEEDCMKF